MSRHRLSAFIVGAALLAQAPSLTFAQPASPPPSGEPAALPPPPTYSGPGQPAQPYYQPGQPVQPYYQPGQPTYGQPAYPPPPPYDQPTYQPPYGQPTYQPPPYTPQPTSYRYPEGFRVQAGMGLRVSGLWNENSYTGFGQGGIGGEFLLRVHRRLTMELAIQYQHTGTPDYSSGYYDYYDRSDVPMMLGLRVHLGNPLWAVSPYLVFAGGADYAWAYVPDAAGNTLYETAWFVEGQLGFGLEFRLGRHLALNLDLRGMGRARLNSTNALFVTDGAGGSWQVMGHQGGVQFNGGLGVFF